MNEEFENDHDLSENIYGDEQQGNKFDMPK